MLLSGERIEKICLLTGRRLYLLRHVIGRMEVLNIRNGEAEGREGIERKDVQIEKSVAGFVTVGICFWLAIIVSIIRINCIFCNFDRYKKISAEYRINMSTRQNKYNKANNTATQNRIGTT